MSRIITPHNPIWPTRSARRGQSWLRSLFPLARSGSALVARNGKLVKDVECCCPPGTPCMCCTKCIRGAWITLPSAIDNYQDYWNCDCSVFSGTYYVPINGGLYCNVLTSPGCGSLTSSPFTQNKRWPDETLYSPACGGSQILWIDNPSCPENYGPACWLNDGGDPFYWLGGLLCWGLSCYVDTSTNNLMLQSHIYLDNTIAPAIWYRTVVVGSSPPNEYPADCSQLNGSHELFEDFIGGNYYCLMTDDATMTLDFAPCPAEE